MEDDCLKAGCSLSMALSVEQLNLRNTIVFSFYREVGGGCVAIERLYRLPRLIEQTSCSRLSRPRGGPEAKPNSVEHQRTGSR